MTSYLCGILTSCQYIFCCHTQLYGHYAVVSNTHVTFALTACDHVPPCKSPVNQSHQSHIHITWLMSSGSTLTSGMGVVKGVYFSLGVRLWSTCMDESWNCTVTCEKWHTDVSAAFCVIHTIVIATFSSTTCITAMLYVDVPETYVWHLTMMSSWPVMCDASSMTPVLMSRIHYWGVFGLSRCAFMDVFSMCRQRSHHCSMVCYCGRWCIVVHCVSAWGGGAHGKFS